MKNKGSAIDIIILIAAAFAVIFILAGLQYGITTINDALIDANIQNNLVNLTDATEKTIGKLEEGATTYLKVIAFFIIFGLVIAMLITNFAQKSHPVLYIVFVLITIVAVVASAVVANEYEEILGKDILGGTLQTYTAPNYFMLYLPIWVSVIGILAAIILFINIPRDRGTIEGGGL